MKYPIQTLYKLIAEAANSSDFEQLLEVLIEKMADIREGEYSMETRQAVVKILQDALDTIRRMQKTIERSD